VAAPPVDSVKRVLLPEATDKTGSPVPEPSINIDVAVLSVEIVAEEEADDPKDNADPFDKIPTLHKLSAELNPTFPPLVRDPIKSVNIVL